MNALTKIASPEAKLVPRDAIFLVETEADLRAAQQLNLKASVLGLAPIAANTPLIVMASKDAVAKVQALAAAGVDLANVRYVDLRGVPFEQMAVGNTQQLRDAIQFGQLPAHWDVDRWLAEEEDVDDSVFLPLDGHSDFAGFVRPRLPELCVVLGGYGSGKSTFSLSLALQILTSPDAVERDMRMSLCAWEDETADVHDFVGKFGKGNAPYLRNRIRYFRVASDNASRKLEDYLKRIEQLTDDYGIRLHLFDPWNEFDHDMGRDSETLYVRRMMAELQAFCRRKKVIVIMTTHLTKQDYQNAGPPKRLRLANAAGSAEFGNKAQRGICIQRTRIFSGFARNEVSHELIDDTERQRLLIQYGSDERSHQPFLWRTPIGAEMGSSVRSPDGRQIYYAPLEHTIVEFDKVKVEDRPGRPRMGRKGAAAYWFDADNGAYRLDHLATELLARVWRF